MVFFRSQNGKSRSQIQLNLAIMGVKRFKMYWLMVGFIIAVIGGFPLWQDEVVILFKTFSNETCGQIV